MNKSTVIALEDRAESLDPLTELLRVGARQLIEQAVGLKIDRNQSRDHGRDPPDLVHSNSLNGSDTTQAGS